MNILSRPLIQLFAILLLLNFYSCSCTTEGDCVENGGFVLVSFKEIDSSDKLSIEDLNIRIKSDRRSSISFNNRLVDNGTSEAIQFLLLDMENGELSFDGYNSVMINLSTNIIESGGCCDAVEIASVTVGNDEVTCSDGGSNTECILTITLEK